MKQALQQLFTGFMYSIMTLSLILGPIPKANLAWAQEAGVDCYVEGEDDPESRVYKPGCDMDGIVQKAQMKSYTEHQSSFAAIIEQAVAGMMAVVLLQSLRYKYLHEEKPQMYGNDCSANTTAKYTLRIAQLGALSYLLGDIKANMSFQKASKKATDAAFGAPAPMGDAGAEADVEAVKEIREKQKNDQIKAFDTLVKVYEEQERGLKAKVGMATLAEAAYIASTGLEMAGIIKCNGFCATNLTTHNTKFATFETLMATAISAATAEAATVYGSACSPAIAALGGFQAAVTAGKGASEASDQAILAAEAAKNAGEEAHWAVNVFAKVKSFFGGDDISEASKEEQEKIMKKGTEQAEKLMNMRVTEKDDAEAAAAATKDGTQLAAKTATDGSSLATVVTAASACTASRFAIGEALNAYIDYIYTPVECCGGPAHNTETQSALLSAREALVSSVSILSPTAQGTEKAKTAAMLGVKEAQKAAAKKAMDEAMKKAVKSLGSVPGLDSASMASAEVNLASGTLAGFGLPKPTQFWDRKDIRVLGITEGLFGGEDKQTSLESLRFYVKKNFESLLRRVAIVAQLEEFDEGNPQAELAQIAELEQKVNNIMFFFDRMIDESVGENNANKLAFEDFKKHELWPTIINMVGDMLMPKAQAFMGDMAKGLVVSAGLKLLQKELGSKGPWGAILNVTSQFMMLSGILGKYGESWGFVKPKGRVYTWGAMSAVNLAVVALDIKAKNKVKKYISSIKSEKKRYLEAAGHGGVDDSGGGNGEGTDGDGRLVRNDSGNTKQFAISGGNTTKSCAVPKGQGFAPAPCPSKVPKSAFTVPKPDRQITSGITPSHLDTISFVSDYSSGLATGSKGVDDLGGIDIEKVQSRNQAMRNHNEKLMKKIDQMERKRNKGKRSSSTPLASLLATAKRGIISSSADNALASLSPGSFGSGYDTAEKDSEKNAGSGFTKSSVYGNSKTGGGEGPAAQDPLDFGFGDLGGVETEESEREIAVRGEEELDDYVLQHDDINKRKDVSIFKILSNRYLLSYPKVMDEKKPE